MADGHDTLRALLAQFNDRYGAETAMLAPDLMPVESWSTFRDRAPAEPPMLVERIWPEGAMGFIGAAPKAGKTWCALALSLAVATGRPFLGAFPVPEQRSVLYVALEGGRAPLRDRVGALARGMGIDPDTNDLQELAFIYKPPGINLSDPEWSARLVERAREVGASLVVIDVLRRAASIAEDGKGAADFAALLRNLGDLEAEGRALAFCHHYRRTNESNKNARGADRMAGSGALHGALDAGLFIVKNDGAQRMTLEVETRDLRAPRPFQIELTGAATGPNGGWRYEDTITVCADLGEIPSAAAILTEQLLTIRQADPTITKDAAAAQLGTTRHRSDFTTAWAQVDQRLRASSARVPLKGGTRTTDTHAAEPEDQTILSGPRGFESAGTPAGADGRDQPLAA